MRLISTLLITLLFFLSGQLIAQQPNISHNFKIQGLTKIANLTSFASTKMVEYDPQSPDHLLVSLFDANEKIVTKTRFLFKGKKFELVKAGDYIVANNLILDGPHTCFFVDGSIDKELVYANGKLFQETIYYPEGTKKSVISGDEQTKDGSFKMWHANGQLWFSGVYANNQRNGVFQQFDDLGKLIRKGEYQQGKLVSGDPVVPDILYKTPEILAKYANGNAAFNDVLKARFDTLKKTVMMDIQTATLNLVIDKNGRVVTVGKTAGCDPVFYTVSATLLKGLTGFTPAQQEIVPVDSELMLKFQLSPRGFAVASDSPSPSFNPKNDTISGTNPDVYTIVEKMPEYPGGLLEMRKFIAMAVRYPVEAQINGIMGKVFVSFVIDEEGNVTNIKIAKGVHKSVNQEAVRVVSLMGKWVPGLHEGKPVKVAFTVPINFNLQVSDPSGKGFTKFGK